MVWDDEARFIEAVPRPDVNKVVAGWQQAAGGGRILQDARGGDGKRELTLADANRKYTQDTMDDWPHPGERAYRELSNAREGGRRELGRLPHLLGEDQRHC